MYTFLKLFNVAAMSEPVKTDDHLGSSFSGITNFNISQKTMTTICKLYELKPVRHQFLHVYKTQDNDEVGY